MNTIQQDLMEYLVTIIKSMLRSTYYFEAAIFNGSLIVISDHTIMYMIDLHESIDPNITYAFYGTINNIETVNNQAIYQNVIQKYQEIMILKQSNVIYENENLRDDEKFEALLGRKADAGAGFYFMHAENCTPFIPVFAGFPVLSAQDTAGIELHDIGNHVILVHMKIYKKKLKAYYDMFYKIIDVNRPLYEKP